MKEEEVAYAISQLPMPAQLLAKQYDFHEAGDLWKMGDLFIFLRMAALNQQERNYWRALECHIYHDCPMPSISDVQIPAIEEMDALDACYTAVMRHDRPVTVEEVHEYVSRFRKVHINTVYNAMSELATDPHRATLSRRLGEEGKFVYTVKKETDARRAI